MQIAFLDAFLSLQFLSSSNHIWRF